MKNIDEKVKNNIKNGYREEIKYLEKKYNKLSNQSQKSKVVGNIFLTFSLLYIGSIYYEFY